MGTGNRNQLSDLEKHKDSNCYLLHPRQQHKGSSWETDLPRPRGSSNTEASSFTEMQLYPARYTLSSITQNNCPRSKVPSQRMDRWAGEGVREILNSVSQIQESSAVCLSVRWQTPTLQMRGREC